MSNTHEQMRRDMQERQYRMQDSHERGQAMVADQLFQTEEALSNRVRIFAAAVLAVSWGLLLEQAGATDRVGDIAFDTRLIFGAAIASLVSLIFDFAFWSFRRAALTLSYRRGAGVVGGLGAGVSGMKIMGALRAVFFFTATGLLAAAASLAFWPVLMG